ncbi:hypothetical protein EOM60_04945 [Candidatus Saccharibacteria bacterium]|nr:hypothetical protein [Candidatus Saccharibacteria bacterium]
MARPKKKRNKQYSGADASATRPNITRVQAVNRGKIGQWLYEKKRVLKTVGIIILVVIGLIFVISGIISIFSSGR